MRGREPAAALAVAVCGMLSAIHYTDMCLAHAGLLSVFGPVALSLLGLSSVCFRLPQNSVGVCESGWGRRTNLLMHPSTSMECHSISISFLFFLFFFLEQNIAVLHFSSEGKTT